MKIPSDIKWIKAEKGEGISVVYYDKEGNKLIRRKDPTPESLKGSKAWRHNNPGNLASGSHSKQHGAIGLPYRCPPKGYKKDRVSTKTPLLIPNEEA